MHLMCVFSLYTCSGPYALWTCKLIAGKQVVTSIADFPELKTSLEDHNVNFYTEKKYLLIYNNNISPLESFLTHFFS